MTRQSPYDGEETTVVTMHLTSVAKVISVPPDHLQNQVDVYGMLCKGVDGGVPGAVRCESISVSAKGVHIVACLLFQYNTLHLNESVVYSYLFLAA